MVLIEKSFVKLFFFFFLCGYGWTTELKLYLTLSDYCLRQTAAPLPQSPIAKTSYTYFWFSVFASFVMSFMMRAPALISQLFGHTHMCEVSKHV